MSLLMATVAEPGLLLLDEHTAALDPRVGETIIGPAVAIGDERKVTTAPDLISKFHEVAGETLAVDRMLLE